MTLVVNDQSVGGDLDIIALHPDGEAQIVQRSVASIIRRDKEGVTES